MPKNNCIDVLKSAAQRAASKLERDRLAATLATDLKVAVRATEKYVRELENQVASLQHRLEQK